MGSQPTVYDVETYRSSPAGWPIVAGLGGRNRASIEGRQEAAWTVKNGVPEGSDKELVSDFLESWGRIPFEGTVPSRPVARETSEASRVCRMAEGEESFLLGRRRPGIPRWMAETSVAARILPSVAVRRCGGEKPAFEGFVPLEMVASSLRREETLKTDARIPLDRRTTKHSADGSGKEGQQEGTWNLLSQR